MEKTGKEGLAGQGQVPAAAHFQRAAAVAAELKLEQPCEALFREGMRQHPELRGWLQYEFAVALERFGRLDEALELFRAAKQDPRGLKTASFAGVKIAKLLEKQGKVQEAAQIFAEIANSKDALAPLLAEAGAFETRQGRMERGLQWYLEAFRRAREEGDQIAVGNVMSEGIGSLPGLAILAHWFRTRTDALPLDEQKRIRRALATTFGNHAWKLLNEGAFADAGTAAEMALVIYAPDVLKWVEGNRAHAYLFQGRVQEAREIHERYQDTQLELDGLDWKNAAREDFNAFREKGLVTAAVEAELRKLESLLGIKSNAERGTGNAQKGE
jgi:tetratricopeptide (TPR) repeat protein